jgi:hypothetical protein
VLELGRPVHPVQWLPVRTLLRHDHGEAQHGLIYHKSISKKTKTVITIPFFQLSSVLRIRDGYPRS